MLTRVTVLKKKAKLALKKGRVAEAGKYYSQVCNQSPEDLDSLLNLGAIRNKQGMYSDALACFKKSIRLSQQNAEALAGMGEAYFHLGQLVESQKHCEVALRINPGAADACYTLANVFRVQNGFDAAESYYSRVVTLDPSNAMAHYYLGNMLKTHHCILI